MLYLFATGASNIRLFAVARQSVFVGDLGTLSVTKLSKLSYSYVNFEVLALSLIDYNHSSYPPEKAYNKAAGLSSQDAFLVACLSLQPVQRRLLGSGDLYSELV